MLRRALPSLATTPAVCWATLSRELRLGERDSLRAHLIRGIGGSFALSVTSRLLGLAVGVVLARTLGAAGFGVYAYAFALLELLKVPTVLGLPALVTRDVAIYHARRDWKRMRGLLVRANQAVLGVSLLLMLLAGGATWLLTDWFQNPQALATFWVALLLLPFFGLTALRGACLRGLRRVVLSQVPETLVRPAVFLGLIGTVWLLGGRLTPASAMGLQLVAVGAAFVLGAIWLLRSLPQETTSAAAAYETRTWAASALPFLLIGGINVVNGQIGLIMLGWFGTAAEVGVYRVAAIGSGVVLMAFSTAWGVLGPTVARLYALGETAQLQRVLTLSARAILLFSLPVTIALILFGERILSAVFGPEYAGGATALAILAVGQLVNAGMGLAILLLNMSGNERDTARGVALAAALNVALNAGLIPLWGTNGAALATTLSLLAWRLAAAGLVRRRTGLHATAFGPVRFKPHTRKPKPR